MTCSENDNCVLYQLEVSLAPLAEMAILSDSDNITTTERYFIQRVSKDKPRHVPHEFKDLAMDRMIHLVNRLEISQLEFSQLVLSAQSQ